MRQDIPVFTLFGETSNFPDIVHCESFSARAPIHDWRITAHRHAQIAQLFLVHRGHISGKADTLGLTLSDGQCLFVPAQTVHEFEFEPDTTGRVISIPVNLAASVTPAANDLLAALSQPFTGSTPSRLHQMTELLVDASHSASAFRAQEMLSLTQAILSVLANIASEKNAQRSAPSENRLAQLRHLLTKHVPDGWTARDYAQALSLSTGHLSRLCRDATGQGLTAFIEQFIMDEASRLLAFTQLPISQVGYRVGFEDPSYFSKRFRKARQISPSDYRAQFLSPAQPKP